MEPAPHPSSPPSDAALKDALRIQAAAVAAQQAALGDEEARLHERRAALEQQEAQLAAHLEEKRHRLVQLHEEARAARAVLHQEQAAYQQTVEQTERELAAGRKEVDQAQAERRRLIQLRTRLKKRWHRHWLAERRALAGQASALAAERAKLQKERDEVQQEKARVAEKRLQANGEIELGKRQLRDEWDKFRQEQESWKATCQREKEELSQRAHALQSAEAAVIQAERDLAYDRHQWQGTRLLLERETAGLDARIVNQRRKIVEQQSELVKLGVARQAAHQTQAPPAPSPDPLEPAPVPRVPDILPPSPDSHRIYCAGRGESESPVAQADQQKQLQALQRLADDLADQRLQVVEQWARLAHTQERWQRDRDAAAADLETLAARLAERERALLTAQRHHEETAAQLRRQHLELTHRKHHLEAWHLRLRSREAVWEGERDRLLAELRGREEAAEQLHLASADLRRRWARRRKQELEQLQTQRAAVEKVRAEWLALRADWWRRTAALDEKTRSLAERELALERYRQQLLTAAPDAAAAERMMDSLARQLTRQHAAATRRCQEAHHKLHAELEQLTARHASLQHQVDALLEREATLAEQHVAQEERETQYRAGAIRHQEQLRRLVTQRERYELEILQLQDELERVAQTLLEESSEILPTISRAA